MTRNEDFDGVGSLASRWILAEKLLERQPLCVIIKIHESTSLVVKAPLLYRQVLPKGNTILFLTLQKACPVDLTQELPWQLGVRTEYCDDILV
jgi:hypothetical protein